MVRCNDMLSGARLAAELRITASKDVLIGAVEVRLVVGSGMGGMTTSAMLAKLGRRVLVLEQHYVPGGFTHAFPRKGYNWDVGVHVVGEVARCSQGAARGCGGAKGAHRYSLFAGTVGNQWHVRCWYLGIIGCPLPGWLAPASRPRQVGRYPLCLVSRAWGNCSRSQERLMPSHHQRLANAAGVS